MFVLACDSVSVTPSWPDALENVLKSVKETVRGRLIVNNIQLAIEAAARGLGIARLPGVIVIEGLAANQLVEVLDAYAPPAQPVYAVYASGGRVSPAARAFLEIAKRHLERRLSDKER